MKSLPAVAVFDAPYRIVSKMSPKHALRQDRGLARSDTNFPNKSRCPIVKLFISHSNADLYVAQSIRLRLGEVSDKLDCFLLADDVFGGEVWEDRILRAANECDAIVSIVTPNYTKRPWFVAEWAIFWFQAKPWYLLLGDVSIGDVFEPMRKRQALSLRDRKDLQRFLESLVDQSAAGQPLDLVAAELVASIQTAFERQAKARAEANLAVLAMSMRRGTDNVDAEVVRELLQIGMLDEIVERSFQTDNSVALRQLSAILIEEREFEAVARIHPRISNRAERRSVAVDVLDVMSVDDPQLNTLKRIVGEIFRSVNPPQQRDLREAASKRGVDIQLEIDDSED